MNKTFGDLMSEYMGAREQARQFDSWSQLDKFVEELVSTLAPKVQAPRKFQEYAFDDMGLALHVEEECLSDCTNCQCGKTNG
jgi:hypothetical protein